MADKTRRTGDLVSDNNIFVDIVNDRVGIGTTNPSQKLDVNGNIRLRGAVYDNSNGIGNTDQVLTSTGIGVSWQDSAVSGVTIENNGSPVGTAITTINFSSNVTATASGSIATITSSGGESSISISSNVENQSQYLTYATSIGNTTGLGVTTGGLVFNPFTGRMGIGTNDPSGRFQVDDLFTVSESGNILNPAPAFVVKGATDTIMEIADDVVQISKPLNLGSTLFSASGITATGSLKVEIDNTVDISYVGGTSTRTGNSLTLTGIEIGDLVLFFSASDSDNQNTPSSDWNAIPGLGTQPDNDNNPDSAAFYKFSTGTSVTASGLNDNDTTAMLIAFRGVNPDQPFSVDSVESTGTTGMPNPPSITTIDDECMIVAVGLLDDDQFTGVTGPSGYFLAISEYGNSCTIMSAYKAQTSAGSENPGAFSGAGSDDYKAQTIALKVDRRPLTGFSVNNTANVFATSFNGSGSGLTNLPAGELSGTAAAINGSNITSLNASNLSSGTVPDGTFPATLPAVSGANLTSLNGTNISSGTVAAARVATLNQNTTGTADNFTVTANNSTDETVYPVFVDGAAGSQGAETSSNLTYNPSSRTLDIQGSFKVQDDIFDADTPSFVINKTTSSDLVFKTDNNAVNIGAGISCTILDDAYIGVSNSKGLILTSPNGTQYRLIVANDGTLSTSSV